MNLKRVILQKKWDKDMRYKYLTRHNVMSESDFFNQPDKIMNDLESNEFSI